jgi:hypothetical protein
MEMERGTDPRAPRVQDLVAKIEHSGREILERALGSKMSEAIKTFGQFQPLIPQFGPEQTDEVKKKVNSIHKLFNYVRRART